MSVFLFSLINFGTLSETLKVSKETLPKNRKKKKSVGVKKKWLIGHPPLLMHLKKQLKKDSYLQVNFLFIKNMSQRHILCRHEQKKSSNKTWQEDKFFIFFFTKIYFCAVFVLQVVWRKFFDIRGCFRGLSKVWQILSNIRERSFWRHTYLLVNLKMIEIRLLFCKANLSNLKASFKKIVTLRKLTWTGV